MGAVAVDPAATRDVTRTVVDGTQKVVFAGPLDFISITKGGPERLETELPSGRMAHPIMFDDDDPVLARVRAVAHAFPDADEKISHGRPAFFTKKIFAYYGASVREDGQWIPHDRSIVVLADPDDRRGLEADPRTFIPAYLGPSGWIGLDLGDDTDWDEVAELIDASYRLTAPTRSVARLVAESDAQNG